MGYGLTLGDSMSKDDTAVKDDGVVQDTPVQDSAPVETKDAEVAENDDVMEMSLADLSKDESSDEDETEGEAEQAQVDEPAAEEPKADPQPQGEKPLAPKSENRFQKLANENRELKEQLDRLKSQETQVATENELLGQINPQTGDYFTPQEAERIARQQTNANTQQTLAQERYQLEVRQNQETLASEAERALQEFPMFDSQSKDYNPQLAAEADELLKQSLLIDESGVLVGSSLSPYQLYKTIANSTQANSAAQQAQAQKSLERMTANADVGSSATQATRQKVDPMLSAFDEEAGL